jgi:hypothetical protein
MNEENQGVTASPPGSQATPEAPVSAGSTPSVSIPNAVDLIERGDALLHPTTGAMRGLFGDDPPSKLLRIRVGELRRFDAFVRQTRAALASGIEGEQSA